MSTHIVSLGNGAWFNRVSLGDVPGPEGLWVAPAFWDLQSNGRWGVSFSDDSLTIDQVADIVHAHAALGVARLCPTLITTSFKATLHGVRTIRLACERWPEINAMVLGIHLEGPWISEQDGYRGAHPLKHVRDPDLSEFEQWQQASGGRIILVTLAPERSGAISAIQVLCKQGVAVALGHTAAEHQTIQAACLAGARLSTHLGNAMESHPARHPNPIWDQAAHPGLQASLIADGHHLGPSILRVLVRAKGMDGVILVSDFSPLAGLPAGSYGAWSVHAGGKIVVTGTPYLAGANRGLAEGLTHLMAWADIPLAQAWGSVTTNPARLIGQPVPDLLPGSLANLVVFRVTEPKLLEDSQLYPTVEVLRTCVDGRWHEPLI